MILRSIHPHRQSLNPEDWGTSWWVLIFSFFHKCYIRFQSGDWLGHSSTFIFFLWNHLSLLCSMFWIFVLLKDPPVSSSPFWWTDSFQEIWILLVQWWGRRPHAMVLPPSSYIVGVIFLSYVRSHFSSKHGAPYFCPKACSITFGEACRLGEH